VGARHLQNRLAIVGSELPAVDLYVDAGHESRPPQLTGLPENLFYVRLLKKVHMQGGAPQPE
jgi:hypothetical protein